MEILTIQWFALTPLVVGALAMAWLVFGQLREQFTGDGSERRLKHFGKGNVSQGEEVPDE